MALDSSKSREIVTNWYMAMGRGDGAGIMGALDKDVVFILAPKPWTKPIPYLGTWKGPEGFGKASEIRNSTSQITGFELREVIADGNKVVALINSKSTCIPTGVPFELDVVQFLELNDEGKITKCTAYFDPVPEINAFAPGSVKVQGA
jgi:ketosteroid isomerase-like protein